MGKRYEWRVQSDGTEHLLTCDYVRNEYALYVDDDLVLQIPEKSSEKMRQEGIDVAFEWEDLRGRLVVWDYKPDVVLDGRLIEANAPYIEKKVQRKKTLRKMAIVQCGVSGGIFLLTLFLMLFRMGNGASLGTLLVTGGFFIAGMHRLQRQKKEN